MDEPLNITLVRPAQTADERLMRATAIWHTLMEEAYRLWRRNQLPPHMATMVPDVPSVTGFDDPTPTVTNKQGEVNW